MRKFDCVCPSFGTIIFMFRKTLRFFFRAFLITAAAALILLGLPRWIADHTATSRLFTIETVPAQRVAIVFGAGLTRSGNPSAVLRDRVETAAALYQAGKVEKLLMSGDNRFVTYNEPAAMQQYAMELGVPEADIVLDFAGRRTYDTCYRARHIFGVHEAVLVTQSFHMPRAVFTCSNLGVESAGVTSDVRRYGRRSLYFWNFRETAATSVALWELFVSRPLPVLGKPEPIFQNASATPHTLTP